LVRFADKETAEGCAELFRDVFTASSLVKLVRVSVEGDRRTSVPELA
jgi:hypothetical protein